MWPETWLGGCGLYWGSKEPFRTHPETGSDEIHSHVNDHVPSPPSCLDGPSGRTGSGKEHGEVGGGQREEEAGGESGKSPSAAPPIPLPAPISPISLFFWSWEWVNWFISTLSLPLRKPAALNYSFLWTLSFPNLWCYWQCKWKKESVNVFYRLLTVRVQTPRGLTNSSTLPYFHSK